MDHYPWIPSPRSLPSSLIECCPWNSFISVSSQFSILLCILLSTTQMSTPLLDLNLSTRSLSGVSRVTKARGYIELFRKRFIMGSEYGSWKSYNLQVSCSTRADVVIAVQTQISENEGSPWCKLWSKSKGLDNQDCQWLGAREDGCPSSHREKKFALPPPFVLFKLSIDGVMPTALIRVIVLIY